MLFLPYSTDAPIYHWPVATASIIFVNVVMFFGTWWQVVTGNLEPEQIEWLILQFDQINPLQWITQAFMHGDPLHLLSNMFFLWAFGLIVEGKIGTVKFLAIYFFITVIDGAAVQVPMFLLGVEGGALGASGVIFGLMMIALMWAPENEVEVFFWFIYSVGTFEIRIIKLAGTFLFLQLVFLWLGGFQMSSEMLHLIGAAIGAPIGLWMLKNKMVDCEDWDVISRNDWLQDYDFLCSEERREELRRKGGEQHDPVAAALAHPNSQLVSGASNMAARSGTMTRTPAQQKKDAEAARKEAERASKKAAAGSKGKKKRLFGRGKATEEEAAQQALPTLQEKAQAHPEFNRWSMLLRQAIQANSVISAQQHFGKLDQLGIAIGISDKTLFAFVKLLAGNKQWLPAMRPLQLVVSHEGPMAADARLRIAQVQFKVMHQPVEAVKTLRQIQFPAETLTEPQRKILQQRDQLMSQCGVRPGMVAKPPSGE